jgi:two-component system phosphate regulon sensor histidine kinase PhoR
LDLREGLPPVRGDRGQLIQLLDNLISNAVRYGCDRPGSTIEIAAAQEDGWVRISVTDHGPGIPREHLPRLTERFYRADEARSRESGGTGLGLAIVKHIVERHRGSLDIRSTPGVGTTVAVSLPVAA